MAFSTLVCVESMELVAEDSNVFGGTFAGSRTLDECITHCLGLSADQCAGMDYGPGTECWIHTSSTITGTMQMGVYVGMDHYIRTQC